MPSKNEALGAVRLQWGKPPSAEESRRFNFESTTQLIGEDIDT
ncbi:MAG TPA: hypothetical protein VIV60_07950 [Polyangiaceae bacterium]